MKHVLVLFCLTLLGACASTSAERRDSFHRFVQPDPDASVIVDTVPNPDRCYSISKAENRNDVTIVQRVDCAEHAGVVETP